MFIVAANWKMNGDVAFAQNYALSLANIATSSEIIILPPFPLLSVLKGNFKLGGQNCYLAEKGAFTGEISPNLLKDLGCEYVLLGHSERREIGESSELIAKKVEAAHAAGLKVILCAGEKAGEDFASVTFSQLDKSLPYCASKDNTIIAYEPVWAIGSGVTPTAKQIDERHKAINEKYGFKTIYGGSVKGDNAHEISAIENVNGLLVGGASLDVEQFKKIIASGRNG